MQITCKPLTVFENSWRNGKQKKKNRQELNVYAWLSNKINKIMPQNHDFI